MDFTFSDDQLLFQDNVRAFLTNEVTPELIRELWSSESGRSDKLWAQLTELGLPALTVPDDFGGLGMDELDFILLAQECGYAGLPEPLVDTVLVGVPLLSALGSDQAELQGQWLSRIAEGQARLAVGEPGNPLVADAHVADLLLLPHGDEVHAVLDAMLTFVDGVWATAGGPNPGDIHDVVNIGIGGSDLGPQMVVMALEAFAHPRLRCHFVSNIDGQDLAGVLRQVDPKHTLFIVASKTFTTQETMVNARTARQWFLDLGGTDIARHFVATTSNIVAAAAFGITTTFVDGSDLSAWAAAMRACASISLTAASVAASSRLLTRKKSLDPRSKRRRSAWASRSARSRCRRVVSTSTRAASTSMPMPATSVRIFSAR